MRIDTHMHIGGETLGFTMTESMVLEAMAKYKISYAIISNCDAAEMDHQQKLLPENLQISQEDALVRTLKFARKHPDKIGVAVWVKPYLQGLSEELETMIRENLDIIYAIKLHPYHSNVAPTDERIRPYLELASKYHLAVVSHTGSCEAASSVHLLEASKQYPEVPFVMVHMGLGTDNQEALHLLGQVKNLYGDTTWVPMETTLEAIQTCGSEKMVFGSDAPIDGVDTYLCNPKGEPSMYQKYFNVLPNEIPQNDYENLMYKNAMRIFGIKV